MFASVSRELTTNEKGAIAEAHIAAAAVELGCVVLRPDQEGRRYDLVIDNGQRLIRVQCKWGALRGDKVVARTGTSRHTPRGYVWTRYQPTEVDGFGIFCAELDRCFWVPIEEGGSPTETTLHLSHARNRQRVDCRMAESYPFGAVAQMARASGWQPGGRGFESLQLHTVTDSAQQVRSVGSEHLRTWLGECLVRVRGGEEIVVTRRGRPIARLVPEPPRLSDAA